MTDPSEAVVNVAKGAHAPIWQVLWRYRAYVVNNALHDFLHKYAGTWIGLAWNVIHPIMLVTVFAFIFTLVIPVRFSHVNEQTLPFVLFLCAGLLPWLSFVDALQRGTGSFVENAAYLRKLAIPEDVFLARTLTGSCILLCINLTVLVAVALVSGLWPKATWLLVPCVAMLMMAFAFGLSAFFGTVNVFARDVAQFISICTQAWMWLTPITYPTTALPMWLQTAQLMNPAYPFIELMRTQFLYGQIGDLMLWIAAVVWTFAALVIGGFMLQRFRSQIRDVL